MCDVHASNTMAHSGMIHVQHDSLTFSPKPLRYTRYTRHALAFWDPSSNTPNPPASALASPSPSPPDRMPRSSVCSCASADCSTCREKKPNKRAGKKMEKLAGGYRHHSPGRRCPCPASRRLRQLCVSAGKTNYAHWRCLRMGEP